MLNKIALGLALGLSASSFASQPEFRSSEVIVKYKRTAVRSRSIINPMYSDIGVERVHHLTGAMSSFEILRLKEGIKLQDALAELSKNPVVEYAQPNFVIRAYPTIHSPIRSPIDTPCVIPGVYPHGCVGGGQPGGNVGDVCKQLGLPTPVCKSLEGHSGAASPSTSSPEDDRPALRPAPNEVSPSIADPDLSKAYGIAKIGALSVHQTWIGSKSMIVAVIDTGIDYNHEDLAFNVWRNPHPTQNDVVGYDFIHNDGLPFDDNEHGTHCAGTIGAVGGNGIGITGVSQRVSIMGLKFLSAKGEGDTAGAIEAIDYAIEHGAKIISASWGGTGDDQNQALKDAIDRAKAKDVLFVAAAGNDGRDNDDPAQASYPAGFDNDNLISVAATDSQDQVAYFSNYGKITTHLAAPGVDIYSLRPGNQYQVLSGTSMAAPHAAGAAALLWSKNPSWTYHQVKEALMKSVDPLPALADKSISGGRLNIFKALNVVESGLRSTE